MMLAWMKELIEKFLAAVLALMPLSPFNQFIDSLEELPYLGYLNYFVPVGAFLKIGAAWLAAIALFYVYSLILRWIKAID